MEIKYDYKGASINVLKNNKEKNILYLSLKKENKSYSHYYNFFVNNSEDNEGTIFLKNINLSPYYRKKSWWTNDNNR